jgi:threonine dehydrogenase-like Zn-dependent dehydrogenase
MRSLIVHKPGGMSIVEIEKPVPGPHEILAKVLHTGICATDLSIADGTLNLGRGNEPVYPVRIGHEWSGRIVETGGKVSRFKPGERIISDTGVSCNNCGPCHSGDYEQCENRRSIGTIRNCWPGAFAEYMLMPDWGCCKIPDAVSSEEAALVEPAMIGFKSLYRAPIGPGSTLLVIGTGPISLGGMACAKAVGTGTIILAGRKEVKLKIGEQMGADILINMEREDLAETVMGETGGKGADVVLDSTGAPDLLNVSISLTRSGGTIAIPGFYEKPVNNFIVDNLVVRKCTLTGGNNVRDMPRRILDLLAHGMIRLAPMITDRYPFEKVLDGFKAMKEKNDTRVKVLIDF